MTQTSDGAPDVEMLLAWLGGQRRHVARTVEGLSDDDAHRPMLPSGWTPMGMVQHLGLDVERFWFRWCFGGEQVELPQGAEGFTVATSATVEQVLGAYADECARADEAIRSLPLSTPPQQWHEDWPPCHLESLGEGILHVIVETATHAGHLDAARELIDGRQDLVLT